MVALVLMLTVATMACTILGVMKFPWEARTFREMSPQQRVRLKESMALIFIPLTFFALFFFGLFASIS